MGTIQALVLAYIAYACKKWPQKTLHQTLRYTLRRTLLLGYTMTETPPINLTTQFAFRLRDAMLAAGFNSQRSASGVCIHTLAEITGYSVQICRRYLRGEAIPEPAKLLEIASRLQVSPGWLLFGDQQKPLRAPQDITLSKKLLHYVFKKAQSLYTDSRHRDQLADFLTDLTADVSHIHADDTELMKIIDLAMHSVIRFEDEQRN